MFRRLRVKLTVLYAGLFCTALTLLGATAYAVIANNTVNQARTQLSRTAAVFERTSALRLSHLESGARALAAGRDLAQALPERDEAGIQAALMRLRGAVNADFAFFVTREGLIIDEQGATRSISPGLQAALTRNAARAGVMGHEAGLAFAALAETPGGQGWVVAGDRLDGADMREIERLASLPVLAVVTARSRDGWLLDGPDAAAASAFIDQALQAEAAPARLQTEHGKDVALAVAIPSLDGARVALLLRHTLSSGLSPYRTLFNTLFAIALIGLSFLIYSAWLLSRGITQPLSTLEEAARHMQDGVYDTVKVQSADEVGRLAETFNAMSGAIREREKRITQLAYHDTETRLPNRLALERRLASAPQAERLYLAAIGVDRFAHVRGAIGYAHASTLMRTLGARLARLAPNAPMGRLSTDVLGAAFLAESDADALRRAEAFVAQLEESLSVEGQDIDVHVTIGVAQPRAKDESPASMIERASVALDQTRAARSKAAFFDKASYGDPARNLSLMGEMHRALETGAIFLAHQPKFDFRTGRIDAAECLVRWRHPARGMIAPDLFVPMAEETGHVRVLTEWVLERAIADQRKLCEAGKPLTLSINISGRLLSDSDFARKAVALARTAPAQLCFEITETAIIDNPELALENIERFAAAGVRIAIDDYGAGLSSLAYLKQLPAHELKIDKLFVQSITNSQRDALLVRSTIDLAHGLGMDVVAEGVETPAAFALLASMRCDLAQGYLVSRPATLEELIALVSDENRLRHYQQTAAANTRPQPVQAPRAG